MNVSEVAYIMGKSTSFIRKAIRLNQLPFAIAIKMNSHYSYYINENQFLKFMGLKKNSEVVRNAKRFTGSSKNIARVCQQSDSETEDSSY